MNIIKAGIILGVYLFLIFLIYLLLSSPFEDIMTGLDNVNGTNSDAKVEGYNSLSRTAFDIVFGALGCAGIIWFIIQVFQREPGRYYY